MEQLQQLLKLIEVLNTKEQKTKESSIYDDCIDKYCIIRSYGAGVFFGIVKQIDDNYTVKLEKARRIHYWDEHTACSISELALYGITESNQSGKDSRIALELPLHFVQQIIEIIPCSKIAIDNISKYKIWAENK
jgi:hypothetical protein